jgi:hypothetical protein
MPALPLLSTALPSIALRVLEPAVAEAPAPAAVPASQPPPGCPGAGPGAHPERRPLARRHFHRLPPGGRHATGKAGARNAAHAPDGEAQHASRAGDAGHRTVGIESHRRSAHDGLAPAPHPAPPGWREWDCAKLDVVLAHEGAHVAHQDWVAAMAARLTACVFWFDPLSWWMERKFRGGCSNGRRRSRPRPAGA